MVRNSQLASLKNMSHSKEYFGAGGKTKDSLIEKMAKANNEVHTHKKSNKTTSHS